MPHPPPPEPQPPEPPEPPEPAESSGTADRPIPGGRGWLKAGGQDSGAAEAESVVEMIPTGDALCRVLAEARRRRRVMDRAVNVAAFNGGSAAIMAGLCAPMAIFSAGSLAAAAVLGAAAWVEFAGRRKLRQLDDRGLIVLTYNQMALGGVILLYALWRLVLAASGRGYADGYADELARQIPDFNAQGIVDLIRAAEYLTYGLLMIGTLLFQGLTAWYYWTRRAHLARFVRDTPAWAIDMLRAAA